MPVIDRALRPFSDEFVNSLKYDFDHPGVYPGFFPENRRVFVKVFNSLSKSALTPTRTGTEARAHAAFFRELARRGFFHPQSHFLVSEDSEQRPTVVAIIPGLKFVPREELIPLELFDIPRHVLGVQVPYHSDLSGGGSELAAFNFGFDKSGGVHFHDLHVLRDVPSDAVMAWYRRRVNEKRAALGMPPLPQ